MRQRKKEEVEEGLDNVNEEKEKSWNRKEAGEREEKSKDHGKRLKERLEER